jgi:predicted GNAT family acetyltransferase
MENEFSNNKMQNQFELKIDDETAILEYYIQDKKIFLNHTEVPVPLRGNGIAAKLVSMSLQYSRDNGLTVVPACSYVAHFIDNHPEWHDVLSEGYQM